MTRLFFTIFVILYGIFMKVIKIRRLAEILMAFKVGVLSWNKKNN